MDNEKSWNGNAHSVFVNLGASNHSNKQRDKHDYYATEPIAAELLLEVEPNLENIWECACGEGHIAEVFRRAGKLKLATDIIDRGYGDGVRDFLDKNIGSYEGDIVTNPPYKYAQKFVEKALNIVAEGSKICMFLKLQFLEGKARKVLFQQQPPKTVYVSSSRLTCAMNGDFEKYQARALAYAWFVWEKGYKGETVVKWIN